MPFPQDTFANRDALLTITRALPAQNTTVTSGTLDLQPEPAMVGTLCDVVLDIPATATATGQTFTFTIQDSADGTTGFAAVAALAARVITGVSNATAATQFRWRLPSNVRRYLRVSVTASATTGDQTAISATLRLMA